ncbi:hypothetical protein OHS33_33950 [Streptomyces sp. NBC_00536]|uniref:hypothetical protein n=1 Tax=Streptomyces sp. NBC_00536 TaxID=2975769 RepID=UPI002E81C327|nr:hypothetical protein [Streptomyces sp. NBC_00536]WUC82932.1 hypothetical protein OHS33_33950 [Streptomyces sp. NBC_00536]
MRFTVWWTVLTGLTLVLISAPGPVELAVACGVAALASGFVWSTFPTARTRISYCTA